MSRTVSLVAVSGSLQSPSKTTVLVTEILDAFAAALGEHVAVETHLMVASPVYRASFTGLFKHVFDFVGQYSLIDTPVLLAATGGSDRHALIIDHQFRPLFSFF